MESQESRDHAFRTWIIRLKIERTPCLSQRFFQPTGLSERARVVEQRADFHGYRAAAACCTCASHAGSGWSRS